MTCNRLSSEFEFRFVEGWPPSRESYDRSLRAHVLQKHFASKKSRSKKKQLRQSRAGSDADEDDSHNPQQLAPRPSQPHGLPISFLLQAAADPFHSFAEPLDNFEVFLSREYCQYWFANVASGPKFQVPRDIFFMINASDPLTLAIMLAYGAQCLLTTNKDARLHNSSLQRQGKAIHQLQERLQIESTDPSDAMFIAVAGYVCTMTDTAQHRIRQVLCSSQLKIHLNGLRSLILASGGWNKLKGRTHAVTWIILWVDAQVHGALLNGLTQPAGSEFEQTLPLLCGKKTLDPATSELLHMYHLFHRLAIDRSCEFAGDPLFTSGLHPIWLFQPITCVYPILRFNSVTSISRVVPLVYINIALCHAQSLDEPAVVEKYHSYRRSFLDIGIAAQPTTENLLWALMTDTRQNSIRDISMLECTMRLTFAMSKLALHMQDLICDNLCDFILLFEEDTVIGKEKWITPKQFAEILTAQNFVDDASTCSEEELVRDEETTK